MVAFLPKIQTSSPPNRMMNKLTLTKVNKESHMTKQLNNKRIGRLEHKCAQSACNQGEKIIPHKPLSCLGLSAKTALSHPPVKRLIK